MARAEGPGGTLLFCPPFEAPVGTPSRRRRLPSVGDAVGGRYRLVEQLGEGQFGRVYRAERTDLAEHHVALKVIDGNVYAGRDAEQELRLLSAVAHPHIVQLADHGVAADHVWFTMPLYQGEPLDARVARQPLAPREAYEVFAPIAEGLEVLHAVGLRHQDVKPDNLFLASFRRTCFPLLLDLGAAGPARAPHPVAGTLLYAAPEQRRALMACVRGELHRETLSETVDTYGLAATLLRCLVGEEFFPGAEADHMDDMDEAEAALEAAAEERASRPLRRGALPGLTGAAREELSRALASWMSQDGERRPSVKQMRAELGVLLGGEAREQRRRQLRRAALWSLGAAAVVGALGAAAQREQRLHLRRCTDALVSTQQEATASVSNLDQCKDLLVSRSAEAQSCRADLLDERQRRDEERRRAPPSDAWQARAERCEGERRAAVAACNADIEALVREQTAVAMERDLLRSERDQLRGAHTRAAVVPAASASAAPQPAPPPAAPQPPPLPDPASRPGPRARRGRP